MIRKLAVALVIVALSYGSAFGYGIQWSSVVGYLRYANGSTDLAGGTSSVGCFVQLIWVGGNGLIDQGYYGSNIDGTGTAQGMVGSDDKVVSTAWIGEGGAGGGDGWFDSATVDEGGDVVGGRSYYLRAWTAPASSYASGYVPTSSTNKYLNSAPWTWTKTNPSYDPVDFTSAGEIFSATHVPLPIPEPAALGLGIIGLISLRFFNRKRK
jgi:hypothetical protein